MAKILSVCSVWCFFILSVAFINRSDAHLQLDQVNSKIFDIFENGFNFRKEHTKSNYLINSRHDEEQCVLDLHDIQDGVKEKEEWALKCS